VKKTKNINIYYNLISNREFRKVRSKLKQKIYRGSYLNKDLRIRYNLVHYSPSKLKLYLVKDWYGITVPENFCLIEDHEASIKFLNKVRKILEFDKPYNLEISHLTTNNIGLGASFLFDSIIKTYEKKWARKKRKIGLRGNFSGSREVNNFLVSYGLLYDLDIKYYNANKVDKDYASKLITLKITGSQQNPDANSIASHRLANYFQLCFKKVGINIEEDAIKKIESAISEIIGNAEEHCGNPNSEWHVLGFFNKDKSICNFSLINYGDTIYESLSNKNSTSKEVLETVEKVILSNASVWKKITTNYDEYKEVLWNVMALQDGISSKKTAPGTEGSSRGQGLMEMLSFIDMIRNKDDNNKIAIISGKSKILVDYEYEIINKMYGETEVRQIIFNKEQELHNLQDDSKAILMSDKFQGTIITGSFVINKTYLTQIIANNGKSKNN
jgi:hypothetical protein